MFSNLNWQYADLADAIVKVVVANFDKYIRLIKIDLPYDLLGIHILPHCSPLAQTCHV